MLVLKKRKMSGEKNEKGLCEAKVIGCAKLYVRERQIIIYEDALSHIIGLSSKDKSIFDVEFVIVPGVQSFSFDLVEKALFKEFEKRLESIKNNLTDKLYDYYKTNSAVVVIEDDGVINLPEQVFLNADFFNEAWGGETKDDYDLLVGVRDNDDHLEYYIYSKETRMDS